MKWCWTPYHTLLRISSTFAEHAKSAVLMAVEGLWAVCRRTASWHQTAY